MLRQLADGSSTKQIARSLAVGQETVKTHLSSIYRKLGAANRAQAVAAAFRSGLLR